MEKALLDFLACPREGSDLIHKDGSLVCVACEVSYPIVDEVVFFLSPSDLTEPERKEQQSRDEEAGWYDSIFEGYPNAVEVSTVIRRIGTPTGLLLDHGSGTGRIAEALTGLGQPVIALDYSLGSLRKLVARAAGPRCWPCRPTCAASPSGTGWCTRSPRWASMCTCGTPKTAIASCGSWPG